LESGGGPGKHGVGMDPTSKDGWFAAAGRVLATRYRNTLAFYGTALVVSAGAAIYCGANNMPVLSALFGTIFAGSFVVVTLKKPEDLIKDRTVAIEEIRAAQYGTKEHPLEPEEAEAEPVRKHEKRSLPERDHSDVIEWEKEREKVPVPKKDPEKKK
jgi:hypothetical protein